jgi:hypothetical protein
VTDAEAAHRGVRKGIWERQECPRWWRLDGELLERASWASGRKKNIHRLTQVMSES